MNGEWPAHARALGARSGHLAAHDSNDRRFFFVEVAIAAAGFVLALSALAWLWAIGTFGLLDITDLGLYRTVAADLLRGAVLYRDFARVPAPIPAVLCAACAAPPIHGGAAPDRCLLPAPIPGRRGAPSRRLLDVPLGDPALFALFLVLVMPWSSLLARTRELSASLARRFPPERYAPSPLAALGLVLLVALFLRAVWLNLPSGALIFDETYYVNAARVMLGWPVTEGAPYATAPAFIDPNAEHPPLGKALIAASMLVLGDTGVGWRLPSVVAGMVALVALYGVVREAGGHPWLAVLAVTLYSLDVLSFVHARIATLDMMAVALMLVGAWLGLRRHWVLAGAALALATLVKLPSAYGLLALLAWQGIGLWRAQRRGERIAWPEARPVATLLVTYGAVFLVGLWLLDLRFTTHTNPLDHVQAMLRYGFGLQPSYDPNTIASAPWDWLVNGGQFDYLKVAVNSSVSGEVVGSATTVQFRALMNPVDHRGREPDRPLFGVANVASPRSRGTLERGLDGGDIPALLASQPRVQPDHLPLLRPTDRPGSRHRHRRVPLPRQAATLRRSRLHDRRGARVCRFVPVPHVPLTPFRYLRRGVIRAPALVRPLSGYPLSRRRAAFRVALARAVRRRDRSAAVESYSGAIHRTREG